MRGRDAHLAGDLADLSRRAAVGTALVDGDPAPDDVLLELVEGELDGGPALRQRRFLTFRSRVGGDHDLLDRLGLCLALELVLDLRRGVELRTV